VPAGEQPDQDPLHHQLLPDDHLAHLGGQLVDERGLLQDQVVDDANIHGRRRSLPGGAEKPPYN
jgi:hypothetical protein